MLTSSLMQTFYAYNAWANRRILDFCAALPVKQFTAEGVASFSSIRDTLVHTFIVQNNWLHRFQKLPLPAAPEAAEFQSVPAVREYYEGVESATQRFVAKVTDEMLAEVIHYDNSLGKPSEYTLWQMMLHQVNHATQHRSEIAVILTQYNHSPGGMDLLVYLDSLKGS